jgi:colicin import membrane protein
MFKLFSKLFAEREALRVECEASLTASRQVLATLASARRQLQQTNAELEAAQKDLAQARKEARYARNSKAKAIAKAETEARAKAAAILQQASFAAAQIRSEAHAVAEKKGRSSFEVATKRAEDDYRKIADKVDALLIEHQILRLEVTEAEQKLKLLNPASQPEITTYS